MIDFIKLNISYLSKSKLLHNPNLEWIEHVNRNTGEISKRLDSKYENMNFTLKPSVHRVHGSIHKLHRSLTTGISQNFDDFTYADLKEIIEVLSERFNINPKKTKIENLEYGVNVNTIFAPKKIINENLIMWDYREPNSDLNFERTGKFKQWSRTQYHIKCYDKGLHYQLPKNILRFEKRVRKSAALKNSGIVVLNDLLNFDKLIHLRDDLLTQFDKLLILDAFDPLDRFTPLETDLFNKGVNPLTWYNFSNKTAKMRFKKKFAALTSNYELDKIKQGIRKDIFRKYDQLLCYQFTDYNVSTTTNKKRGPNGGKHQITNKRSSTVDVTFLPVNILSKRNKLSKEAISDIDKLHSDHPARKKPRNDSSNPRNNLRKSILKIVPNDSNTQLLLFPIESVIQLSKDKINILKYWKGTKWDILDRIGIRS